MAMPVSEPRIVCVGSGLGQNGSTSKRGACTDCADAAESEMSATRGSNAFDFIVFSRVMTDAATTDVVILRRRPRAIQRVAMFAGAVVIALVARPTPIEAHEIPASV